MRLPTLIFAIVLARLAKAQLPDLFPASQQEFLTNATANCIQACQELTDILNSTLTLLPASAEFQTAKAAYWSSFQTDVSPACFVSPASAKDVSSVLSIAKLHECPFAVKSGGHAAFAGGSNIQEGITIDLRLLNELILSDDRTTTRVGPGNRWVDVYDNLSPKGLTVIGGRVADIGVGGLTLGGGISYFSPRYGWACDNVASYEIVVADGSILDVDVETHPDLYWALRGGGNNFGIVTSFSLETYKQGDMWSGSVLYNTTHDEDLLKALHDFAYAADEDIDASLWVVFGHAAQFGGWLSALQPLYAKPEPWPRIYNNFSKIANLGDTLSADNISSVANNLRKDNPWGLRDTYWTITTKVDLDSMKHIVSSFKQAILPFVEVAAFLPALVLQPLTAPMISHFSKNGGNALGIELSDAPLLNINLAVMWADTTFDDAIFATLEAFFQEMETYAKQNGVHHRYIYQNYAAIQQGRNGKVFDSYGDANAARLREIAKKYDPEGVFQKLQPGYFKLW